MIANELFGTSLYNDANLVSYWRMEGNSNDSKGSNNGTDTAITYGTANGKFGQGAGFNGTTSKVLSSIPAFSSDKTICAWIYTGVNNSYQEIFGQKRYISAGDFSAYEFRLTNTGKIQYTEGNTGGTPLSVISTGNVPLNQWVFVMCTISGTTATLYINNSIDGTVNASRIGTFTVDANGSGIGILPAFFGADNYPFNGKIDEVSVFSKKLTESERQQLYYAGAEKFYTPYKGSIGRFFAGDPTMKGYWQLNGSSVDNSGNGNNGTDTNVTYVPGKFEKAASFNGASSEVAVTPQNLSGGAFTIMGFFKWGTNAAETMYSESVSGNNNPYIALQSGNFGADFALTNRDASATGLVAQFTHGLKIGNEYHIAWTCSTTQSKLYVNGNLIRTDTFTANSFVPTQAAIGRNYRVSKEAFLTGTANEVVIQKRELSPQEISQYYLWATSSQTKTGWLAVLQQAISNFFLFFD